MSKQNVNNTKYYEILGVGKDATAQEIRKSYRKLVIKLHPDKGGDPGKFEELQNAYEVLSDPKKREVYDKYGEEGIKQGMGNDDGDFDPFSFFGFGGGNRARNEKRKCKAKKIDLHITLEDAYNGAKKVVEFKKRIICPKCKGNGSANPNDKTTCSSCNGKGIKLVIQRMGNMVLQSQKTCDSCNGEGTIIKEKCKECNAEKVKTIKHKINVDIDKGVPDGHRYKLNEEGDQYPEVENGDLIIEIFLDKHRDFIRKGADLIYKCEISLLEALIGFKTVITHLDGRKIIVMTKEGEIIKPKVLKTVKECGMPFFNRPYKYGNLYIDFQIDFPSKLSEEQIEKITKILKNDRAPEIKNIPKDIEKYPMTDYNPKDENTSYKGGKEGDHRDEDDEDEDGGGYHKTVNCANQ